jgi:hypothetical protein
MGPPMLHGAEGKLDLIFIEFYVKFFVTEKEMVNQ